MKRASYREGVVWIGANDEGAERDPSVMAEVPSVLLLAALFEVKPERVAEDVLRWRRKDEGAR